MNPTLLSGEQELAFAAIRQWLATPGSPQVFQLLGLAGTGKTTLAGLLPQAFSKLLFLAPTNRAAAVLRARLPEGSPVWTLHAAMYQRPMETLSVIYKNSTGAPQVIPQPFPHPSVTIPPGESRWVLTQENSLDGGRRELSWGRPRPDSPIASSSLVVVDEASMVGEDLALDLLSYGVPVLALGDPGQLPPVRSSPGLLTPAFPSLTLHQIHRQAAGSPIIRLAHRIRRGERLSEALRAEGAGSPGSPLTLIGPPSSLPDWLDSRGLLHSAGQTLAILVGRNLTRFRLNHRIRTRLGLASLPYPTKDHPEPTMVLSNDKESPNLCNGTIHQSYVEMRQRGKAKPALWIFLAGESRPAELWDWESTAEHANPQALARIQVAEREAYRSAMRRSRRGYPSPLFSGPAYAVTTHKFQGSQAPDVVVCASDLPPGTPPAQWLYTAITRAQERLAMSLG